MAAETIRVARFVFFRIHTEDGLTGVGEAHPATGTAGNPYAVLGALQHAAELISGRDAEQIERIWFELYRSQVFRGGADAMAALSAVDVALWDLAAQRQGAPLHALIGGAVRDRIRLYVHVNGPTPLEVAAKAKAAVASGYTVVRIYPFGSFEQDLPPTTTGIARSAGATIDAVREAVGPEIDIIVDSVCRLTPEEALQVAHAMAAAQPLYFEDPIGPEDPRATARFAARSPVPVGAGERLLTIHEFQSLLADGTVGYVRPDPSLVGGITGMRRIAVIAEAGHAVVVPHNPLSPVLTATCAAFAAATPVSTLLEYVGPPPAAQAHAFSGEPKPVEGYLPIPAGPGLGVRVIDASEPESYARRPLMQSDGSLRDY